MSVTQLRAFHFVAMAGGYSQAAREISISQSTLSAQVRQLEASSGLSLFERTPRGVILTPDGRALYNITSRLFAALGQATNLLKSQRSGTGRLRVCADGVTHALPILAKLRERRPELNFQLVIQNSDRVVEHLLQQQADVGISANPLRDERLYVRPLINLRIGAFVPKTHPWGRTPAYRHGRLDELPFRPEGTGIAHQGGFRGKTLRNMTSVSVPSLKSRAVRACVRP